MITGAASGIGKAMAERFAYEHPRGIVVADQNQDGAERVAAAIGKGALAVGCDVSRDASVGELIALAEEAFGGIDIFCANAGMLPRGGLETSEETWNRAVSVNVLSHVYAARRLVPRWLERGEGYFMSTASAAGLLTQIGDVAYPVTKHAAVALAEWLAITYRGRGVRVSCLCPMGVDTPLFHGGSAGSFEGDRGIAPASRPIQPEVVANEVVAAMRDERFLILPHPEVREHLRRRGDDHERWLRGMQRLQTRFGGDGMSELP